jgi:hypothetical protein
MRRRDGCRDAGRGTHDADRRRQGCRQKDARDVGELML